MQRIKITPRPNLPELAKEAEFGWFLSDDGVYWDESAYWLFSEPEIDDIETATETLWDMVMIAVGAVIDGKELPLYGYNDAAIKVIEHSWYNRNSQPTLYARFDFAYDGTEQPKLLEINGDTPTSLFEASVFQWSWLEELFPDGDQFNSIHDKFVEAFQKLGFFQRTHPQEFADEERTLHFSCVTPHPEDEGTINYVAEIARQAGLNVKFVGLTDIGWRTGDTGRRDRFTDLGEQTIRTMFKLVPWEWLLNDPFGQHLAEEVLADRLTLIEPAWKMVLSNKRLLTKLWELFPYHPNLLNASMIRSNVPGPVAKKPILGREGANVTLLGADDHVDQAQEGNYEDDQFVYQERTKLAESDGNHAVIGSWIIDGKSAGMGIRESRSLITNNTARFVPHRFE